MIAGVQFLIRNSLAIINNYDYDVNAWRSIVFAYLMQTKEFLYSMFVHLIDV